MCQLKALLSLIVTVLCMASSIAQSLVINEAVNNHFISVRDFDGDFWAWVEIHNRGNQPIELSDYYLTNTLSQPIRYALPALQLQPGSRRLVLFSGKDTQQGTFIHANFTWDRRQNVMYLLDSAQQLVDHVRVPELPFDHSWGRQSDGDSIWMAFSTPTPGTPNHWGVAHQPTDEFVSVWPPSGVYQADSLRIEMGGSSAHMAIRYTTNGQLPDHTSTRYTAPFWMRTPATEDFRLAGIRTNPESAEPAWIWRPPNRMPETGNVLTVALFDDSIRRSPYVNAHYFIGERNWPVAVVSIRIDSSDLFDHERGIYVPGKTYENNPVVSSAWGSGNYHNRGRLWERQAHVALFEPDGTLGFEQSLGVRIHGGGSRTLPQKSLRLYGRYIYEKSHIPYAFFPDDDYARYDRMLLRNGGQGFLSNPFNDVLVNAVMAPLQITQQRSRPVEHFINGEYWGVANLRNRIDERFLAHRYDVSRDDVRVIEPIFNHPDGRDTALAAWLQFLEDTPDMAAEGVYEAMRAYIDIDDFRDYYLARIFSAIFDWPMNNRRLWRHNDGVLRNIFFDSDDAFQNVDANTLEHALEPDGPNWPNAPFSTFMFRKLIENDRFRESFIERYETLARTQWQPDRMVAIVDSLQAIYRPLMERQINRWQYPRSSVGDWLDYVDRNRTFLKNRHCVMRNHFIEAFDLSDDYLYEYDCTFNHLSNRDTIVGRVFPNPSNGTVTLDIQSPEDRLLQLAIYNAAGQAISRTTLHQESGRMQHQLSMFDNVSSGVYMLHVTGETHTWQTKLIIH